MKDFYGNVVISSYFKYELIYNRALGNIIVRQWHLLSPFQLVVHHIICHTNSHNNVYEWWVLLKHAVHFSDIVSSNALW